MKSIGEKIREIRQSKGISQTVVATACGIKQSSYANIENGNTTKITTEIGKGIAIALNVDFNELFDIQVNNQDNQKLIDTLNKLVVELDDKIVKQDEVIDLQRKLIKFYEEQIKILLPDSTF